MPGQRPRQLSLSVRLQDHATFSNYFALPGSSSEQARQALAHLDVGDFVYLWGGAGTGRSHLLQALCQEFAASWMYLPLVDLVDEDPSDVLKGLESLALVVLDDLHLVTHNRLWAEELFHLYNRIQQQGGALVVSADCSPAELGCPLADLRSRLAAMQIFRLDRLEDAQIQQALMLRASRRGFELPEPVALYLLRHFARDMSHQMAFLDRLDLGTLEAKRKLSIPLVKELLLNTEENP